MTASEAGITTAGPGAPAEAGPNAPRALGRPFAYIFFLALMIRVLWVAHAMVTPIGDHYGFDRIAEHWVETGTFCQGISDLDYRVRSNDIRAFRTPAYLGLLALLYLVFGHNWGVVWVAQAVFSALTAGLVFVLAARTISRRVGIWAGVLYALWPESIGYVPVLAGDNLQVFFLIAGLAALTGAFVGRWHWWLAALAGASFALMLLVRPSSVFVLPAWVLLSLYDPIRRVWRPTVLLVVLLVFTAVLMPWLLRNYRLGRGFPTLSTQPGYSFWWGNNWLTNDGANPAPPRFPGDRQMREDVQNRFFRDKALEWIRANPRRFLGLCAVRLARLFGTIPDVWLTKYFWPTEENDRLICASFWPKHADPADVQAAKDLQARNRLWHQRARVIVAPVALVGVLLALTRPRAFALVLLPLVTFAAGHSISVFAARYRVTSDPLVVICLAALLVDLCTGGRATGRGLNRWTKLALIIAAVMGSVLAYAKGWDRRWYELPPGPVPQPAFDENAPHVVAVDLTARRIKTSGVHGCKAKLSPSRSALRLDLRADEHESKPRGGLQIDAAGVSAMRLRMSFEQPENIESIVVSGLDAERITRLRWTWRVGTDRPLPKRNQPETFVLVPAERSGYFTADVKESGTANWVPLAKYTGNRTALGQRVGEQVRELRVVFWVKSRAQTSIRLHELMVAQAPGLAPPPELPTSEGD